MSSFEILSSGKNGTVIKNTPKKPKFPKTELLALVGFIVFMGLMATISEAVLMMAVLMIPLWLMLLLAFVLFPLIWLISVKRNRGKGETDISLNDDRLKVEANGRELLNVDIEQISSIRTGNILEKNLGNVTLLQKVFGIQRFAENMYFLEARYGGKTQIIAWGLDEPSADGILHELGFSQTI